MCSLLLAMVITVMVGLASYVYHLLKTTGQSASVPSSLDDFIRKDTESQACQGSQDGQKDSETKADHAVHTVAERGHQILILFATEYGFSEEIAGMLLKRLKTKCEGSGKDWQPRVLNTKHHQHVDWEKEAICFVIISTCGDGVAPRECSGFLTFLQSSCPSLHHVHVSVLALGDSSYPHFCRAGLQLATRLEELGARPVVPTTRVDGEDWGVIDGWMDHLHTWLQSSTAERAVPQVRTDYLNLVAIHQTDSATFSRHRPFMATLQVKELLNQVKDVMLDRETIHCELDVTHSGLQWNPGDSVGIYPENNPVIVNTVLSLLGVSGHDTVTVPVTHPAWSTSQGEMSMREALTRCYDIHKATPATLTLLQQSVTTAHPAHSTLSHLCSSKTSREDYLGSRSLVQILCDWCGGPPVAHWTPGLTTVLALLTTLRPLQARYYSISSSPRLDNNILSVTMAVVRYMQDGRQEGGVTTTHMQDRLRVGEQLPVFISPNPDFRLPSDSNVPIILICAGTGLSPFRAFIQEREIVGSSGETHLYFGCRHPEKDFLYRQQLERWEDNGLIHLRAAYSRYYQRKVYVQDLLAEDAALIWTLIETAGAAVYVCGDAGQFAPAVHQTLLTMVQGQGQQSLEDADHYLTHLQVTGRYLQDVWLT